MEIISIWIQLLSLSSSLIAVIHVCILVKGPNNINNRRPLFSVQQLVKPFFSALLTLLAVYLTKQ